MDQWTGQSILIAMALLANLAGWLFLGRQADDTNWLQWMLLIVVYEIGGYYGRRYYANGELPYQRLMLIAGLFAIVARILNSSPSLHSPIEASMTLLFPIASCVIFYRLTRHVSDRNWLLRLGHYSGSIYILHEPFITTAVVLIFIKLGLYSRWSIAPIAAICLLLSILLYRSLRRVVPNIDRWLL
jgi:peptidoglycan/LPS O-acetylase OafA/YrhL